MQLPSVRLETSFRTFTLLSTIFGTSREKIYLVKVGIQLSGVKPNVIVCIAKAHAFKIFVFPNMVLSKMNIPIP